MSVEEQVLLAAQELGAVVGEALQLGAQPAAGAPHLGADQLRGHFAPGRDERVAGVQHACVDADVGAVLEPVEDLRAGVVHHEDPGLHQSFGSEVGEAARHHGAAVHHRDHAGVDQRLRGVAVHVEVVEDRDVTDVQATEEAGRAPVDPGGAVDTGESGGWAGAHCELHDRAMLSAATLPFREARPVGRGGGEQLAGMRPGAVGVLDPGQHP